ncbi:conserved hypothetical protein [Histoplasma capsulatum H143]|uniref:Uncharacterized protein n=1 Tax=Ajellomyces capsulatus (strain H143) TaxID=544712 RepID=C6HD78_AJECH|nr:conserved hypothetical protein [Histoplasma capsulatum H143]
MPPKTNTLQNSNRLDKLNKLDKSLRKTSKQTTRQEARRARPLSKSRIDRERQYRLALGGNTRNQKTLTQIDFVKQAQALLAREDKDEDDDLELEYIGGEAWDGDYEVPVQSSKRRKRNGNRRRANTGKRIGSDLVGRKQVDETDGSDDDKTLTQMGYVTGWQNDGRSHNMHAGLGKRKGVDRMENIGKEPKAKMCDGTLQESRANCCNWTEESVIELRTTPTTSPPFAPEKDSDKKLSKSAHSIAKQTTPKDQKTESGDPDTSSFDAEKSKKRVIYETDAETEDEEIHLSCKEHYSWRTQTQVIHDSSSRSRNDDYYDDYPLNELPTQARNSDQETCDTLPKNMLDSEASMLYYRKPMSLSFEPGSELANINTQRLAELFPAAETENEECVIPHLSTIPEKHETEEDSVDHASTTRPTKNSIESSQHSDMGDADLDHTACIDSQNDCQGLVTTVNCDR